MTELGKVGKSRRRGEDDDENPEDSISSEENDDEIDEQSLRVAANCELELSSISPKAGTIITFSKGGLPGEEMV